MKRIFTLFVFLVVAATVAVVPAVNAATSKTKAKTKVKANAEATTVHYIGAGATAMWQGFAIAAYNDLAGSATKASANGICNAGTIQTTAGSTAINGNA